MRVSGNKKPEAVHVEPYGPCPGMAELRLRENVVKTGEEEMYLYDEYVFRIPDQPGLKEEVAQKMANWLASGRALEAGETSSLAADLQDALDLVVPGEKRGRELELTRAFCSEMQQALQLIYDTLNQGQQQKLMKHEAVKALFRQYGLGEAQ